MFYVYYSSTFKIDDEMNSATLCDELITGTNDSCPAVNAMLSCVIAYDSDRKCRNGSQVKLDRFASNPI